MFKSIALGAAALAMLVGSTSRADAAAPATLAVTATNDPVANEIRVYDVETHALIQTLSTHGKGGVGGNARGVKQRDGNFVAVVNFGSNSVALFRRDGAGLAFDRLVSTTSAPVSVDFANDHMYVAGATTVDSFAMRGNTVQGIDGTTGLLLHGGGAPPAGSTAQVGAISDTQLLVTLKADPDSGTVDIIALRDGAISGDAPVTVPGPAGTLAPFGFSVYHDGTALITLAHSAQDALFRDGAFRAVVGAGELGPCWTTRVGKYVFVANTGSRTISRLIGTGGNVFVDDAEAATVVTGGSPVDVDADSGVLAQLDRGDGQSHLSLFTYNEFGELTAAGAPINIGVADANGVAILTPPAPAPRS